ncbi:family S53 protease-like protein [Dichomitus squalens LYAD-421 SS1]|uniref:tripeptidyl-peptidase II n=1 Tax=Dichomitus squalens (strain LYAD-421) TaxID=732165 RepID=R7SN54_DICSQ|nr:family S53 protease-like protein [Dichomitus squalens LYAD-421 SS1]EJF57619.1 family S53 protease-like protein [Dichomitus squalens LYAD-421 SS1]
MVAAGLLAFSFIALALGAPTWDALHVHDARSTAPAGYKASGAPDPNEVLNLRIALKKDNTPLVQKLLDVSTPGSKNYRKFLTKAQVAALTAPSDGGVKAINAWLQKNGVKATPGATNQWLNIELPVSKANALLDADFTVYKNPTTGVTAIRTLAYSVPASVQPYLDFIYPATAFPVQAKKGISSVHVSGTFHNSTHVARADASCATAITPTCLQQFYNVPTDPATQTSSTMAVSSFVNSFAATSDLSGFLTQFRPDIPSSTSFSVTSVDGGSNDETQPSTEGSLDIQYTVGIATDVPTTFFTVGTQNDGDVTGFLDLVNNLIALDSPPSVFTTSFGFPEELVDPGLANNICNAYAQLGARGTSIFFSSGDSGVDDGQGGSCTTFRPTFPSGCPFVTVVGATQGVPPESAADFSSGGFSNVFAVPDYQSGAVSGYLGKLGSTNAGLFNTSGRGYPDISAAGVSYQVNIGGTVTDVSGTSASTPFVASTVALLNDRLVAAGKAPMGFLNPFLYSTGASAFTDITTGNNPGCGTDGFPANEGWDPVTGLGTPDFNKLLTAAGL